MEAKNTADLPESCSDAAEIGKAVAGKTARPCDNCQRQRACWYCAKDEAYLCRHCDGFVHGANSVARRHERVPLSPKMENRSNYYNSAFMARRKRTRSSRPHPKGNQRAAKPRAGKDEFRTPVLVVEVPVPENSPSEEFRSAVEDDDDLLHQVPIFMPLAEEFCVGDRTLKLQENTASDARKIDLATSCLSDENYPADCARNLIAPDHSIDLNHFFPSEADLCEFAADMEMDMQSIIGHGSDEALGGMASLYGTEKDHHHYHANNNNNNNDDDDDDNDDDDKSCRSGLASDSGCKAEAGEGWPRGRIKAEGQEEEEEENPARLAPDAGCKVEPREASDAKVKVEEPDEAWDTIELNIDCNEFEEGEEEELDEYQEPDPEVPPSDIQLRGDRIQEDVKINLALDSIFGPPAPTNFTEERKLISLRLNYEDVLTAWSDRGSPWACSTRLETASDDCSSDGAGLVPDLNMPNGRAGEQAELGQVPVTNNGGGHGGREARVLRYREKRLTRLFSKKIRYEVRKLNAEKRPRMKGRFVKRTSSM